MPFGNASHQQSRGLIAGDGLDPEALAADWWLAFEAVERALDANAARLGTAFVMERRRHLGEQHARVALVLQGIARERGLRSPLVRWLGGPRITRRVLGLPAAVTACVFDLDGVLTTSQQVHVATWAEALDGFLFERAERSGQDFAPFDHGRDYELWVAGRPRVEGLRAFLGSRGIHLPEGAPEDPPGAETVHGLANRKNALLQRRLAEEGVRAFAGSRSYLEAARIVGVQRGVVSASENTAAILERAGLAHLIQERIDGEAIAGEGLRAKPSPDTLLAACARLAVTPARSAAFESSRAGIAAAREAGFAVVVGVNRHGQRSHLRADEADIVVNDLAQMLTRGV
ncbi:MAG: HAD family hydrolase [Thermoleophilia bacterium]